MLRVKERLHRWLGRAMPSDKPVFGLSVEGLPDAISGFPADCNTALTGRNDLAMDLWQKSILRSALQYSDVFLVVPSEEKASEILHDHEVFLNFHTDHLRIFILEEDIQYHIAQCNGFLDFLQDLETAGLSKHQTLICWDLFPMIKKMPLHHLAKIDQPWRQWANRRLQPSIWFMIFDEYYLPSIERRRLLSNALPYAAGLQQQPHALSLYLRRWNSNQGAIFETRYGVRTPEAHLDDHLRANGSVVYQKENNQTIVAFDIEKVYATSQCMEGIRIYPPSWVVVSDWQALEAACQDAVGATAMIDAGDASCFMELAHVVHRLRTTHPPSFKILVKESLHRLRTHNEAALLQLGANGVVYKDTHFSRIVRRTIELQHTWFSHDIADNVEDVVNGLIPITAYGYQPPMDFCEMVYNLFKVHLRGKIDHSLVYLKLLPTTSHAMAIKELKLTRSGDLATNTTDGIALFLYACMEVDVDMVVSRIFDKPLNTLFSSQVTYHRIPEIKSQMRSMRTELQSRQLPDFSFVRKISKANTGEVYKAINFAAELKIEELLPLSGDISPSSDEITKRRTTWKPWSEI